MNKKSPRLTFFGGFLLCLAIAFVDFNLYISGAKRSLPIRGTFFACLAPIFLFKTIFPGKPKKQQEENGLNRDVPSSPAAQTPPQPPREAPGTAHSDQEKSRPARKKRLLILLLLCAAIAYLLFSRYANTGSVFSPLFLIILGVVLPAVILSGISLYGRITRLRNRIEAAKKEQEE